MKFFVDQSLGGLIKWLRLLGFDAVPVNLSPMHLANLPAPRADAYILTRQASLVAKQPRTDLVILVSEHPDEQIAEICRRLPLTSRVWRPLQRCSKCNQILLSVAPEQVAGKVPDYILEKYHQFAECPQCRRVFWEGSHQIRIRQRLQALEDQIKPP